LRQRRQEIQQILFQVQKLRLSSCWKHMHHDVVRWQLSPLFPASIDLPNPALDSMAHHRAAHLAARRDADSRKGGFWGALPKVENHQRAVTPASGSVALQEVRPSPEPLLAVQRLSAHGRGLPRGHGSDSEALTPFSAPPIDDGSTLAGPHPKTKAVGAFPTAIIRLVGSLHGDAAFSKSTILAVLGSGLQRLWVAAFTPITLKNAIPYWIPPAWSRAQPKLLPAKKQGGGSEDLPPRQNLRVTRREDDYSIFL